MTPPAWPPLVGVVGAPRRVRIRDAILTLIMWAAFIALIRVPMLAAIDEATPFIALRPEGVEFPWDELAKRVWPYLYVASIFVGWLLLWSLVAAIKRPTPGAPPALDLPVEAARAGVDAATLAHWRGWRIATVRHRPDGSVAEMREG